MAIILTIRATDNIQSYLDILEQNGGGILNLADATYNLTADITFTDGITLNGNGAILDFGGGAFQVSIQGSNPYSTGTLAVNYGSTAIVGTGTTWTAGMVGRSILIGDYWYEITARTDNTHITIGSNYIGPTISGATYVIADTVESPGMRDINVQNSSIAGIKIQYADGIAFDSVVVTDCLVGIDGSNMANFNYTNCFISDCTTSMTLNNAPFCSLLNWGMTNGGGLTLNKVTNTSIGPFSLQGITGVGMSLTNCFNTGALNFSIIECSGNGIEFISGNSSVDFNAGYITNCGGDGIKLTATSDSNNLTDISSLNNTGWGVNIANANCDINILSGITTGGNGSGALQDNGTGTLKSAAVNNFA